MKSVSIIIPLYNEAESLKELTDKITAVLRRIKLDAWEILFVDDGSTDNSMEVIRALSAADSKVKCISFSRNYGKAAALSVGFKAARCEAVVTMDADLQDDPEAIPDLLAKLDEGYDLVSGWKKVRHDPIDKTLPSKFWNIGVSMLSGVKLHDFNCGFKAYRAKTAKQLDVYGERHRYLPVLAHWNRARITEAVVPHHPRKYGKSKYGFGRIFRGIFDLMTLLFLRRYMKNPMHLFGLWGIICMAMGFGVAAYFAVRWVIDGSLHLRPLMLLSVGAFLMGIQLFSIGLVGEMITHTGKRDEYLIEEELNTN